MLVHAEFLHVKPGKGAAFVRTKLKNYLNGNVVERTFRAGESAVQAVLEKRECQYTYQDGDEVSSCFQIQTCMRCMISRPPAAHCLRRPQTLNLAYSAKCAWAPEQQLCVCVLQFVFMDNETYEETRLKKDEAWSKYMKEGTEAALLFWNGKVISVDPPGSMELEVADTDPGLKGNTASGFAPSLAPHDDGRRCHSLEVSCPPPPPETCCMLHKCF